jgi:hypothetical protein
VCGLEQSARKTGGARSIIQTHRKLKLHFAIQDRREGPETIIATNARFRFFPITFHARTKSRGNATRGIDLHTLVQSRDISWAKKSARAPRFKGRQDWLPSL